MNGAWEPANDTERALAAALAARDQRAFFRVLADADLYLPRHSWDRSPGPADEDADRAQRFVTEQLFGATFLLVFTSVETMLPQVSELADAYTITNYAELREKWPVPEWRLAVNPGSPLEAYVPLAAIGAAAVGQLTIPTAGEVTGQAIVEAAARHDAATNQAAPVGRHAAVEPPEESLDVDSRLLDAAVRGDVHGYVEALIEAVVIMPTAGEVTDPDQILELQLTWLTVGPPAAPVIEVFTSPAMFAEGYPAGAPNVMLPLLLLLAAWPDGHGLSVNPRTPLHVTLPSDQVQLLMLWSPQDEPDELETGAS